MNKNTGIAIALFLLIICIMAIPFTNWWFNGCDDFHGLYLGFRTKTWNDLFWFFANGHINQDIGPTNSHYNPTTTFFSTYYRPLYCVYVTLQYWAFGTNAYWYYLCNVLFHALNTALLFYLLTLTSTPLASLFGALFFAFHPQIGYRFGAIVNLHYYINVFLILCTFLFFKKYLDSKRLLPYFLACLTFTLALFTRESSLVLPAILMIGAWVYKPFAPIRLLSLVPFFALATGFLGIRLYLYPLSISHNTNLLGNVNSFLITKKQEFLIFLYDCFGLSWLPWGHPMLRIALLLSFFLLFLWLFINNKYKYLIWMFLFCGAIMLWPGIIGHYSPRYIYEALPFIIAAYVLCFTGYQGKHQYFKKIILGTLSLLICFLFFFTIDCFIRRQTKMRIFSHALNTLVQKPELKNRPLCFLTYPMDGLGDQPSDIVRVLRNDAQTSIFCDTAGALVQADSNIVTPYWWGNRISALYTTNYIEVTPIKNGFRFISHNPAKIHFFVSENQSYSLGKKIVNKKDAGSISAFTLVIDEQILKQRPVYLVWNYETRQFDAITLKDS